MRTQSCHRINYRQYCLNLVATIILSAIVLPLSASTRDGAVVDSSAPKIQCNHHTVFCYDMADLRSIGQPDVISDHGRIRDLSHEDQYIELGSAAKGFTGYFAPARWEATKIIGDGGVDVTGALNTLLVEGANNALVRVAAGGFAQFNIVIPAQGYVTFDWRNIGGSKFFNQSFVLLHNDMPAEINESEGQYFSPLFFPGDTFGFLLDTEGSEDLNVDISDFRFLTNAIGVVERKWTATDEAGNTGVATQLITIERPSLADVIFPWNYDDNEAPALKTGTSSNPFHTGFPVIDKDGNPATTADQIQLNENNCAFEIHWNDEILSDGLQTVIMRRWTIVDWASGSIMEDTQIIKMSPPSSSDDNPDDLPGTITPENPSPNAFDAELRKNAQQKEKNFVAARYSNSRRQTPSKTGI
jgi:hypothetical protein